MDCENPVPVASPSHQVSSTSDETQRDISSTTSTIDVGANGNSSSIGSTSIDKLSPPPAKKKKFVRVSSEQEVGITMTIGKYNKIIGIVKERYSDFHVNEISLDGNIVHLTSFDLPVDDTPKIALRDENLAKWIDDDTFDKLEALQIADDDETKSQEIEFLATSMDKETRTKVHRWINNFDRLVSETVEKSGEKYILVKHRSKNKSNVYRRPANRARYTHCVLYKEGIETSDAISFLSKNLRLNPNLISYAGTKDKRSKSTQKLCFSNIDAKRLLYVNKYSTQSKLGNFSYSANKISLGDLKGNHFKLLIKNVRLAPSASDISLEECIEKSIESLKTIGFINYYGLQRFGSYSTSTHMVGKALLQMEWSKVFDMILEIRDNDPVFMKKAKRAWLETRDADKAKRLIPECHRSIESNLIYGLARFYDKKDYLSVLNRIPRNVRLLYIHSFQSYIWNQLVTYRIQEYGLQPVEGDLVFENPHTTSEAFEFASEEAFIAGDGDSTTGNNSRNQHTDGDDTPKKSQVKTLSVEELSNYTIFDVVLPLEGTDVQYPNNKVKDYAEQLIRDHGLPSGYMWNYKAQSDIQRGAYRRIMVLPTNVSYRIIPYSDRKSLDSIITSDFDLMKSKLNDEKDGSTKTSCGTDDLPKDKKCLHIEFSLPSSSYATMALREVLEEEVFE